MLCASFKKNPAILRTYSYCAEIAIALGMIYDRSGTHIHMLLMFKACRHGRAEAVQKIRANLLSVVGRRV